MNIRKEINCISRLFCCSFHSTCRRSPAGWPAARWPAPWRYSTSSHIEALPPDISCSCCLQPEEWRPADPPRWWFGTECGGAPRPPRRYPVDGYRRCKNLIGREHQRLCNQLLTVSSYQDNRTFLSFVGVWTYKNTWFYLIYISLIWPLQMKM